MSILEKVRQWIDGDSVETALEEAARDAQVKPRSKAEEFIVNIAREVERVMQDELVPLPQGTVIIPCEYIIFLSAEDDAEWKGVKRKGLIQGLYHILAERAREIAGRKKLDTKSFALELRIDATLNKSDVRVQHSWEDSASNKTGVLARPAVPGVQGASPTPVKRESPHRPPPRSTADAASPKNTSDLRESRTEPIDEISPFSSEDTDDLTRVRARKTELYNLEVWRSNIRQTVIPVYKKEIVVGRGSKSKPVDIPLSGDVEISRRHLSIGTDGEQGFWVVNEGRNPAMLNNYELPTGQRIAVTPGMPISVCSFLLRIQPK